MGRLYYLDAMRSILMMLGIVLHAAVMFSSSSYINSAVSSTSIYDDIIYYIHLFRMPSFFIVSGFFCHMTLSRYGARLFLKVRLPRIIIPLCVTALTLNSLQYLLLADYRGSEIALFSINYWLQGFWVSHLWFLMSLVYYFIFSALAMLLFPTFISRGLNFISWLYTTSKALSLVLLAITSYIFIKLSYLAEIISSENGFNWAIGDSIKYSVYFFFGILAGQNRNILNNFTSISKSTLLVSLVFILVFYAYQEVILSYLQSANLIIESLYSWLLSYVCFIIFFLLANKPSKVFSYFSNASYSIYLFHHVLIIAYGSVISQLSIPTWLMFVSLMLLTFISTVIIHHFLVAKFPIFLYLFNGKRI